MAEDDLYQFDFNVDSTFGAAPGTSGGNPGGFAFGAPAFQPGQTGGAPPSSMGPLRGPPSSMGRMMTGRMMTGQAGPGGPAGRPVTSNKGAGYMSKPPATAGQKSFDPFNQGARGPAPPLVEKAPSTPEEEAREREKEVNERIEASAEAAHKSEYVIALERAKEAAKKERALSRFRESKGLVDQINMDLTYSVVFNLANAYHLNCMYNEALTTYNTLVKNKQYPQAGRLRVNCGNIYYEQKKYPQAIKMYRMALDQIPNTGEEVRLKIMRNIGNAFVRMGRFQDAIQSYEAIIAGKTDDFQTGFNLIVCYYALGDAERMKKGFETLIAAQVPLPTEDEDDEEDDEDDMMKEKDDLKEELRERHHQASNFLLTAAKLIAPVLDTTEWVNGFDWVITALRAGQHDLIASEVQISKALTYLRKKEFKKAIDELKAFEKKDQALKAKAATNLSFLYFLEGDVSQSDQYANLAVRHDRYNARALVNKGNCLNEQGELERAKELYLEAIGVEADCVEAIYNLGLVNKRLGVPNEALQAFEKLHTIIPSSPEVIYQIANLHDVMLNFDASIKYFNYLLSRVPTDPGAISHLGRVCSKNDDETQAYHFHHESYRYFPVNLDVISWLGVWFVKSEMYEKAIEFFERAAEIQPDAVKWNLMVTSCYRRMGDYEKALSLYQDIHRKHPDNMECLRYLVAICNDLGRDCDEYEGKLVQLERQLARQESATMAGMTGYDDGAGRDEDDEESQEGRGPPSYITRGGPSAPTPAGSPRDMSGGYGGGSNYGAGAGYGSMDSSPQESPVRHTAPVGMGFVASTNAGGARDAEEDEFADADLDDLLAD